MSRGSVAPPATAPSAIEGGVLDFSRWPLVRLVHKPRETEDDTARFYKNLELALRNRHGPFAVVADARAIRELSAKQRRIIADHLAHNTDVYRSRCVGNAFVIEGAALRGALTAIFWMTPAPYPYRTFPDVPSAERWALEQLEL